MHSIKIFSGDKEVFLTNKKPHTLLRNICVVPIKSFKELGREFDQINTSKDCSKAYFVHDNVEELLQHFMKMYYVIEAAGGVVKNSKGEYLCIYRNGKWDLPKGKIEKGEKIKEAAIREVEEECGITQLTILKELPSTFHTYYMEEKPVLKRTYWFEMACKDKSKLVPQQEEGITEARWFKREEMSTVLENTYTSIKDLLVGNVLLWSVICFFCHPLLP